MVPTTDEDVGCIVALGLCQPYFPKESCLFVTRTTPTAVVAEPAVLRITVCSSAVSVHYGVPTGGTFPCHLSGEEIGICYDGSELVPRASFSAALRYVEVCRCRSSWAVGRGHRPSAVFLREIVIDGIGDVALPLAEETEPLWPLT